MRLPRFFRRRDNDPHGIPNGDVPHLPLALIVTDADLLAGLYQSKGSGCECGPVHSSSLTLGAPRDHA